MTTEKEVTPTGNSKKAKNFILIEFRLNLVGKLNLTSEPFQVLWPEVVDMTALADDSDTDYDLPDNIHWKPEC